MKDEILEAEAVEERALSTGAEAERPLPVSGRAGGLAPVRDEARTVAIAAAGGLVAGAATVALAKAASRAGMPSRRSSRTILGRKQKDVVASRSFLVDVHLLGR